MEFKEDPTLKSNLDLSDEEVAYNRVKDLSQININTLNALLKPLNEVEEFAPTMEFLIIRLEKLEENFRDYR